MTHSDDCSPTPRPHDSPTPLRIAWAASPVRMAHHLTKGRFQIPRHLDVLGTAIRDAVRTGGRLLVQMPPRHGKSWATSLWTPVWLLNIWPEKRVILASYEADFAASWGRLARNAIEEHQDELLVRLSEDSTAANRWNTPEGGGMITAGAGGAITGRGADLLIIDDPHKNAEEAYSKTHRDRVWEWWTSTAVTRLEPKAAVIVIQTRWHQDDLAGRILREQAAAWQVLSFSAVAQEDDPLGRAEGEPLWPERYDREALTSIRGNVGSRVWTALYQQSPVPDGGGFFKREWWEGRRYREETPGRYLLHDGTRVNLEDLRRWAAVDLATSVKTTADFTVITTVGALPDGRVLVLDVDRMRREGPDILPAIRRAHERWGTSAVWIERVGFQAALIQQGWREGLPVREAPANKDKVARALPLTSAFEGGRLLLPAVAPWLEAFEDEFASFPLARHDDVVDALGHAWAQVGYGVITAYSSARDPVTPPQRPRLTWGRGPFGRRDPRRGRLFR